MNAVPPTSERDLWVAELDFIGGIDPQLRSAQFAIRTAVRAQTLALVAGTDAIDELLDARQAIHTEAGRQVFDDAIDYLYTDRLLTSDQAQWRGVLSDFGMNR